MSENVDHGWLFQRIVEDSPIAILFADREGKIWTIGDRRDRNDLKECEPPIGATRVR